MRHYLIVLSLAGCASGASGAGQVDEPSASDSDEDEPESERERLVREATEKREQCQTLGYAIEAAEGGGQEFVNLNDERSLTRIARSRSKTADRIADMRLSSDPLVVIRDDYVKINRDMASALQETATTKLMGAKKAALNRYREQEKAVETIIERFNDACDGS